MTLDHDDIKHLVAAISKSKGAKKLTMVVKSTSENDVNRYFFIVKKGGSSWKWLGAKTLLNWLGNVGQGAAGLNASGLGALGGGVGALSGKAGALQGLNGAFAEGVNAYAKDTGDETTNRNLMHQLKANGGIQMLGFMDCSGSTTLRLWYGGLEWWQWYLQRLDEDGVGEVGYNADCSILKGQRIALLGGKRLNY